MTSTGMAWSPLSIKSPETFPAGILAIAGAAFGTAVEWPPVRVHSDAARRDLEALVFDAVARDRDVTLSLASFKEAISDGALVTVVESDGSMG